MKITRVVRALPAIALLSAASGCYAYRPAPPPPQYWEVGRAHLGDRIRVHTPGIGRLEGRLQRIAADSIVVRAGGVDHVLAKFAVDSAWSNSTSGQAAGSLVGVAAGFVGALYVIAASGIGESEGRQGQLIGVTMLLGGTVLGGYAGSQLGAARDSWRLVFSR